MEEKKGYDKHPKMVGLARELSQTWKDSGIVGFNITYRPTEGNLAIHEAFQLYCARHSNNEYLQGLKQLLDAAGFIELLLGHEERLRALESQIYTKKAEEDPEKPKQVGPFTF